MQPAIYRENLITVRGSRLLVEIYGDLRRTYHERQGSVDHRETGREAVSRSAANSEAIGGPLIIVGVEEEEPLENPNQVAERQRAEQIQLARCP